MDEQKPQKKESTLEKIIMGAIIGTAIGASIGASIAPKPGKETRKNIWDRVKNWMGGKKKTHQLLHDAKEIPIDTDLFHHE